MARCDFFFVEDGGDKGTAGGHLFEDNCSVGGVGESEGAGLSDFGRKFAQF